MTKQETKELIKKISFYYPYFKLEEEAFKEWELRLKPYDYEDVLRKFEEHLKGERANEPPKLHFIIKYLRTIEEKSKYKNDYIIRCNLCGKEMTLTEYDNTHYRKCLLIKALIPLLKSKGEDVTYEMLDEYDYLKLDKVWEKYNPPTKQKIDELMGGLVDGGRNRNNN